MSYLYCVAKITDSIKRTIKEGRIGLKLFEIITVTINVPKPHGITPTLNNIEATKDSKFVEDDIDKLVDYYFQYSTQSAFTSFKVAYAETIPLRNNIDGYDYGINVDDFEISYIDTKYDVGPELQAHKNIAIRTFKTLGKIKKINREYENNASVRILEWDSVNMKIKLQPANYFDQVGTNLTLDWASHCFSSDDQTIRNDKECRKDGFLKPLKESILANTLGVAVYLYNPNSEKVLVRVRQENLAVMSGKKAKFHCSASGVFKFPDNFDPKSNISFEIFNSAMSEEIKSEIGLEKDEYSLFPVAFTRELSRGGKPQLFFIAVSEIEFEELHDRINYAEESWEFVRLEDIAENDPLAKYLKNPFAAPREFYTYEGWMGRLLTEAYIEKKLGPAPLG